MPSLIDDLAKLIVQDNAVLFVGSELRAGAEEPLAIRRIAEALAERIDYRGSDRTLPAVAQDFETVHGRTALINAIKNELEQMDRAPDPTHQLIADAVLPKTKVITTRFDDIIERALDRFEKPYVLIVKDKDLPFFDESRITLIKMQGDLRQPDSLVITEDDINTFISRLPTLSDIIRAFFATKTLIFLGYDLDSDHFKRFYSQVAHNLGEYRRTAYAIVAEPMDDIKTRYWAQHNVTVSVREPMVFLEELADAVKAAAATRTAVPPNPLMVGDERPLPPAPYKGLAPFERDDAPIFAGRDDEAYRLVNRILANRVTVLHGESGSGKTSLLQAGAGPLLAEQRALLAVGTPARGESLTERLRSALLAAGRDVTLEVPDDTSLDGLVRRWQHEAGGPIVLAIDDGEQLFLVYDDEALRTAATELNEICRDRSLDLRLVWVVREDYLGRLQTLQDYFPRLLQTRFRLERLSREAARAAIEEPPANFNARWDSDAVERVLNDLYQGTSGGIAPPQLQLICERLYREAQTQNAEHPVVSVALIEDLGGVETILGDYLEQALMGVPADRREVARALLATLVSSSGVTQRLSLTTLAHRTELAPSEAAAVLDQLVEQQLVRRFAPAGDETPSYELTHEHLATSITEWLDEGFWAAQGAYEIVEHCLPAWRADAQFPAPGDLRRVTAQMARLVLPADAAAMLYAAAVTYDVEPERWGAQLSTETQRAVLQRLLEHTEPLARRRVAERLEAFATADRPDLVRALVETAAADRVAAVRTAARDTLIAAGETDPTVAAIAVPALVRAYEAPATRDAAEHAIIVWRDRQPAIADHLPASLAQSAHRAVWRRRWRRSRHRVLTSTLRGAQGGFWGLALGMGLFIGPLDARAGGVERMSLRALVQLASLGIPIAGLMGALTAGGSTFVGATLQSLQDENHPRRRWALMTAVSAILLGLGFLLLTYVFSGDPRPVRALTAGLIIGAALGGAASAPISLPAPVHLVLAAGVGMLAFAVVYLLGLTFEGTVLVWVLVMGMASGIGFSLGLRGYRPPA